MPGLGDFASSLAASLAERTGSGTEYRGISDADMLQCQLALAPALRKQDRIARLQQELRHEQAGG